MAFKLGDEEGFRWVGAYEISADELLDGKEGKATETKLERGKQLIREQSHLMAVFLMMKLKCFWI